MNTNKEKLQKRRQILRMSVAKLKAIDMPELQLHRTVCLKNTVIHMQAEVRKARRIKARSYRCLEDDSNDYLPSSKRQRLNDSDVIESKVSPSKPITLMNDDGEVIPTEFFTSPVLVSKISDDVPSATTQSESSRTESMDSLITDTPLRVLSPSASAECADTEQSMDVCGDNGEQSTNCRNTFSLGDDKDMSIAKCCALQMQESYDSDRYHMPVFSEC